jgi:hypothetical protein
VFKGVNGLIDWNFNFYHFDDIHLCNTRHKFNFSKPLSRSSFNSWGQHRFICHVVNEWNKLPFDIRNISKMLSFKIRIRDI